jgi:GH15 family glucan-1,4-alpha-glucosidase
MPNGRCSYRGEWDEAVRRSLITLKALTFAPTGGIVAAPTTSLPEDLGGVRNWDYRFCWLRDATFSLLALMEAGYLEEARAWREWLLRAAAGMPSQMSLLYGLGGERRLTEIQLEWLPGYECSRPVRIGNAAWSQFQLDIYGEVMDAMHQCLRAGMGPGEDGWRIERALVDFLESSWERPDEGIWEVRGPRRHFTHSKMMAWVAFDRAVRAVERFGFEGPVERWRILRDEVHAQVCQAGFDTERGSFVQSFGSKRLDASLLMMPLVGFLPATDPRVVGTVAAIERELMTDGFVSRYAPHPDIDGLPGGEGAFLPCSFWLADNLALQGRRDDARRVFERLLSIRNDLGLLSEEYDPVARRLVGNFPQAFSHIGLINTAFNLTPGWRGPAQDRPED